MERLVKDTRFLEGLDITFKAEPVSIATYGEGDNATAVYRYHVHASDTKGEYPGDPRDSHDGGPYGHRYSLRLGAGDLERR